MKQFLSLSKNIQDIVRADTIYRFSAPFLRILLTNKKKICKIGTYRSYITNLLHIFRLYETFVDFLFCGFQLQNTVTI